MFDALCLLLVKGDKIAKANINYTELAKFWTYQDLWQNSGTYKKIKVKLSSFELPDGYVKK